MSYESGFCDRNTINNQHKTCWKYQLYGVDTKIIIGVYIGRDIANIVCEYLYENDVNCLNEYGELDVDEELWNSIKDIVFPDSDTQ